MIIGVSPAYFLSKFGEHFTPEQLMMELPVLKELGFESFQLEITHIEHLRDWDGVSLKELASACIHHGLSVSQLVVHFWVDNFSTFSAIRRGLDVDQILQCLSIIDCLPGCDVLTVPFGKLNLSEDELLSFDPFRDVECSLVETMTDLCSVAQSRGVNIAMELQPGAIVAGISGGLRIAEMMKNPQNLGYNFDTGHANAMREVVELIPARWGKGRMFGTHLCDNTGMSNLSLAPGEGSIDWCKVMAALKVCRYGGTYDLEIMCPAEEVERQYLKGRERLVQYSST